MPTMLDLVSSRMSALLLAGQSPCLLVFSLNGYASAREQDERAAAFLFDSAVLNGPDSTYNGLRYTIGGRPSNSFYEWHDPFTIVTEEMKAEQHKVKLPPLDMRAVNLLEDILLDLHDANYVTEKGAPWRSRLPNMGAYMVEQGIEIDGARYLLRVTALPD